MANSAKIKIVADTKVKKAINSTIGQLKRLGKASRNATRAMARGVGGVLKKFTSLRGLLVGGALTAGLAKSVSDANAFAQAMAQVDTILDDGGGQIKGMTLAVRDLSAEMGIAASELANGLYQALSAGIPADNAIDFLATASKAAVAGATDVTSAVDLMTTVLNAFKLESSETARVADVLFQTVKLGKTTIGELSQSLALVAPLAASSGVSIEEVAAAVATLTKQGTPTAQAMTQIRAALVATNDVLGDGWSKTMSLQDAFKAVAKQAGGSQVKLRKLAKSVEAMGAILATTGDSAKGAADDLKTIEGAAGAMEKANKKVQVTKQWARLFHSVKASVLAVAGAVDRGLAPLVDAVAAKFRKLAANAGPMEGLAQKIKEFSINAVGKLDAVFKRIKDGAIGVAAVIKALATPDKQVKVLGALALVVIAMFQDAITIAVKMLMTAAPIIGAAIGEAMRTGFKNSIAHAKAEGILRGQAASAAEANGTTFEHELAKARLNAASAAFEGLGKRPGKLSEKDMLKKAGRAAEITGNSFEHELKRIRKSEAEKDSKEVETATTNTGKALSGLAKIIEEERAAIAAALAKATGEGAGNGAGNVAAGKNQPDGRITLQDLEAGKVDLTKFADLTAVSVFDAVTGKILGSLASFAKGLDEVPKARERQHLQKFGDSSRAHLVKRLAAGGGEAKLGFGAGKLRGGFTRLEKPGPEIEKGIAERRGIGMAELFDMKQFGFAGKDDKLGTKNNPMVVAVSEELV